MKRKNYDKKSKRRWGRSQGLILAFVILCLFLSGLRALWERELLPKPLQGPTGMLFAVLDEKLPGKGQERQITGEGLSELPAQLDGYLVMDVLDVGQADATLIRQGNHAMLFDCGAEIPMQLRAYLRREGIETLDAVWLSHADADHIGAFPSLAYGVRVRQVMIGPYPEEKATAAYARTMETIRAMDIPLVSAQVGGIYPFGFSQIHVLGPLYRDEEIPNNNSLAVRVVYGDTSFLLCGDAQEAEELALVSSGQTLASDVLHVNHHGSNLSSREEFLRRVSPRAAVISCGEANDYGHPGEYALRRLAAAGVEIYRTDLDGTVRIISDGTQISVSIERAEAPAA